MGPDFIVYVFVASISIWIGAFFIQLGTRLVAKFKHSYRIVLIAITAFFGVATICGKIIKDSEVNPIGTGKACLVQLTLIKS